MFSPFNCVAPPQDRIVDREGNFKGYYKPPRYRVDAPGIPMLCARGVLSMRFLAMRADFEERFKGCESPHDVRLVLFEEGVYG